MGNLDVYLLDTRRGGLDRLTTHVAEDGFPVWSRKDGRIAFTSNRKGAGGLYEMRPTEGGAEKLLLRITASRATSRQTVSSCCTATPVPTRGGTYGSCPCTKAEKHPN